jgi:hypothetical protein
MCPGGLNTRNSVAWVIGGPLRIIATPVATASQAGLSVNRFPGRVNPYGVG